MEECLLLDSQAKELKMNDYIRHLAEKLDTSNRSEFYQTIQEIIDLIYSKKADNSIINAILIDKVYDKLDTLDQLLLCHILKTSDFCLDTFLPDILTLKKMAKCIYNYPFKEIGIQVTSILIIEATLILIYRLKSRIPPPVWENEVLPDEELKTNFNRNLHYIEKTSYEFLNKKVQKNDINYEEKKKAAEKSLELVDKLLGEKQAKKSKTKEMSYTTEEEKIEFKSYITSKPFIELDLPEETNRYKDAMDAVKNGSISILRKMIDTDKSIEASYYLFELACRYRQAEIALFIFLHFTEEKNLTTSFIAAVNNDDIDLMSFFISKGCGSMAYLMIYLLNKNCNEKAANYLINYSEPLVIEEGRPYYYIGVGLKKIIDYAAKKKNIENDHNTIYRTIDCSGKEASDFSYSEFIDFLIQLPDMCWCCTELYHSPKMDKGTFTSKFFIDTSDFKLHLEPCLSKRTMNAFQIILNTNLKRVTIKCIRPYLLNIRGIDDRDCSVLITKYSFDDLNKIKMDKVKFNDAIKMNYALKYFVHKVYDRKKDKTKEIVNLFYSNSTGYLFKNPEKIELSRQYFVDLGGKTKIQLISKDHLSEAILNSHRLKYHGNIVHSLIYIDPRAPEVINNCNCIELDCTFKCLEPYALCIPTAIVQNEGVPIGVSVGPTERYEIYRNFYDFFMKNWKESELLSKPLLSDEGAALIKFGKDLQENPVFHHFFCMRHIIEKFGASTTLGKLVESLLFTFSPEEFLEKWKDIKEKIEIELEKRENNVPRVCELFKCSYTIDKKLTDPIIEEIDQMPWIRSQYGVPTCSNHVEGTHAHLNEKSGRTNLNKSFDVVIKYINKRMEKYIKRRNAHEYISSAKEMKQKRLLLEQRCASLMEKISSNASSDLINEYNKVKKELDTMKKHDKWLEQERLFYANLYGIDDLPSYLDVDSFDVAKIVDFQKIEKHNAVTIIDNIYDESDWTFNDEKEKSRSRVTSNDIKEVKQIIKAAKSELKIKNIISLIVTNGEKKISLPSREVITDDVNGFGLSYPILFYTDLNGDEKTCIPDLSMFTEKAIQEKIGDISKYKLKACNVELASGTIDMFEIMFSTRNIPGTSKFVVGGKITSKKPPF